MILQNLNFFIIITGTTSVLAAALTIYGWVVKPFRNASYSFVLFSFIMLIVSVSNFFILYESDYKTALIWSNVFFIGIVLAPVAQLILIADFTGFRYPEKIHKFRYLFFSIPLAIIVLMLITGNTGIEKTSFGYIINLPNMRLLTPTYITIVNLLIIFMLGLENYRRRKTGTSRGSVLLLLLGMIIYAAGQSLYQGVLMMGLVAKIPSNSLSLILLYIFIIISFFSIRGGIQNLSLKRVFDSVHDCMVISDSNGEIIEINECMKKKLGIEELKRTDNFQLQNNKTLISEMLKNNEESRDFFKALEDKTINNFNKDLIFFNKEGKQTYNVVVSPILDKSRGTIGKLGIFRDITIKKNLERELFIRNRISNIFLTVPDDEMYGSILDQILGFFESTYGLFGYIDKEGNLVSPSLTRAVWNKCEVENKNIVFPHNIWGGIWGKAIIDKKSYFFNKRRKLPKGHMLICRAVAAPIVYKDNAIGVIMIGNKKTDYTKEDIKELEDLSNFIAPVLDLRLKLEMEEARRKEYEKKIRHMSFHDSLTGLYNRRYFKEELIRFDTQRQLPISIIMADINNLKKVNDRYGHQEGDRMIKMSAEVLKNVCRREDVLARWGGDEFIMLLVKTSRSKALEVIKRIQKSQASKEFNKEVSISISLGSSTKSKTSQKIEFIIEEADKKMYADKARIKSGFNSKNKERL